MVIKSLQYKRFKIRYDIINYYTKGKFECQCKKCDVKGIGFLTIDHINGFREKHIKLAGNNMNMYKDILINKPDDIQILCWNCNCSKSNKGKCYHFNDTFI